MYIIKRETFNFNNGNGGGTRDTSNFLLISNASLVTTMSPGISDDTASRVSRLPRKSRYIKPMRYCVTVDEAADYPTAGKSRVHPNQLRPERRGHKGTASRKSSRSNITRTSSRKKTPLKRFPIEVGEVVSKKSSPKPTGHGCSPKAPRRKKRIGTEHFESRPKKKRQCIKPPRKTNESFRQLVSNNFEIKVPMMDVYVPNNPAI